MTIHLLFLTAFLLGVLSVSAASPAGSSTFTLSPTSLSGPDTPISAFLNTKSQPITAFQIVASYSYSGTQPPIDIIGNSVTLSIPSSQLNCLTNTIIRDTATSSVQLIVGCLVPLGSTFSTATDREIFRFTLHTNSPSSITFTFDNSSTGSSIEPSSADLAPISPVTYALNTNQQASLTVTVNLQDQPLSPTGTFQLLQNNQVQYNFADIALTKAGTMYTYTTPQILNPNPLSSYTLLLQLPYHLDRRVSNITLVPGPNSVAVTEPVRAGDFTCDNVFNLADISDMLSHYTATANLKYDLTGDGVFTIRDIALLLSGYTALSVSGDGPSRATCTTP